MRNIIVLVCLLFSIQAYTYDKLVLTGSSTVAPLLSDIAKAYESSHSQIRIDVQTGGSSRGISDLRKGLNDIGMVSRKLKDSESDLNSFLIAKDGLAIITHKNNPVKELSPEQIVSIYTGKIKNWRKLGGKDLPIVVVNKAEGRSTLEIFLKYFKLKNSQIEASVVIGDNEQGIKTVSKNPYAIGYVSIGTAEYNASVGVPIQLLPLNSVKASVENVENGTYPLARELNLVTKSKPEGNIKLFLDYVLSKKSLSFVEEHYFVPVHKN